MSQGFENEQLMVDYLDDPVNYKLRLGGASFLSQQVENFTYAIRLSYSPRNSGQTGYFFEFIIILSQLKAQKFIFITFFNQKYQFMYNIYV